MRGNVESFEIEFLGYLLPLLVVVVVLSVSFSVFFFCCFCFWCLRFWGGWCRRSSSLTQSKKHKRSDFIFIFLFFLCFFLLFFFFLSFFSFFFDIFLSFCCCFLVGPRAMLRLFLLLVGVLLLPNVLGPLLLLCFLVLIFPSFSSG